MGKSEMLVPKGMEVQAEEWKIAPGLRVGNTLYCSGQLGLGPDGTLPDDAEAQIENAFAAVQAVLELDGGSFADVVEMTSFHVGVQSQLEAFARIRDRYLPGPPYPAQTAIGVAELGLPGALIELKVVAQLE